MPHVYHTAACHTVCDVTCDQRYQHSFFDEKCEAEEMEKTSMCGVLSWCVGGPARRATTEGCRRALIGANRCLSECGWHCLPAKSCHQCAVNVTLKTPIFMIQVFVKLRFPGIDPPPTTLLSVAFRIAASS